MQHIDSLYAKLKRLEATPGTNDKLDIVRELTQDELGLVKLALDPTVNFYIATLPDVGPGTGIWSEDEDELLLDLINRDITGNAAFEQVIATLQGLKPEHADVLRRVILKDLRVGVGTTLVNKAFPGTIPEFPYMRCSLPDKSNMAKWPAEVWARGVYSQEKADGMFASLTTTDTEVKLLSRQGSAFPPDALPGLFEVHQQLKGFQLHGELLVFKGNEVLERQIGNGVLNTLLQEGELPADLTVRYFVWDIVPNFAVTAGKFDAVYSERMRELNQATAGLEHIQVIDTAIVTSKHAAYAHYRTLLAMGKEGTIVKSPDGLWKDGTSKDCVKLKLEVNVELKVKALLPGTGKNAATFGSILMGSECDELEVSATGMSDDLRAKLFARRETLPGTVFTVRANAVMQPSASNPKHSLFLPRLIEERLDKAQADTLAEIKAQFDAAVA